MNVKSVDVSKRLLNSMKISIEFDGLAHKDLNKLRVTFKGLIETKSKFLLVYIPHEQAHTKANRW